VIRADNELFQINPGQALGRRSRTTQARIRIEDAPRPIDGMLKLSRSWNATTASAIETFSGRHLSGFVCHRRMQPYSSPPDRLKNTLPHVGPTTSLRTVILRGDRGLAHTVAMIEATCDVSFGSIRERAEPAASLAMSAAL